MRLCDVDCQQSWARRQRIAQWLTPGMIVPDTPRGFGGGLVECTDGSTHPFTGLATAEDLCYLLVSLVFDLQSSNTMGL